MPNYLQICQVRANSGSKLVVSNTLAKQKKLGPNEFDFIAKKVYHKVVLYLNMTHFQLRNKEYLEIPRANQNTLFWRSI